MIIAATTYQQRDLRPFLNAPEQQRQQQQRESSEANDRDPSISIAIISLLTTHTHSIFGTRSEPPMHDD